MSLTPESYVVDASVAAKWFLTDELLSEQAAAIWHRHTNQATVLAAPSHIYVEMANSVLSATRYDPPRLSIGGGRLLVEDINSLRLRTVPARELTIPAYDLSNRHRITIYDALYVALSSAYSIPLVTADRGLYRNTRLDHDVLWLGDVDLE